MPHGSKGKRCWTGPGRANPDNSPPREGHSKKREMIVDTECVCGDAGDQDTARVALALCDGRP